MEVNTTGIVKSLPGRLISDKKAVVFHAALAVTVTAVIFTSPFKLSD